MKHSGTPQLDPTDLLPAWLALARGRESLQLSEFRKVAFHLEKLGRWFCLLSPRKKMLGELLRAVREQNLSQMLDNLNPSKLLLLFLSHEVLNF